MPQAAVDLSLFVRPIAHRGLHDAAAGLIENSAPAFEAAIAAGHGIECDVRAAAGGLPVVFHDKDCLRLFGQVTRIAEVSEAQLGAFVYPGGSAVLTFAAFLDLVGGRVPILAELKGDFEGCDRAFIDAVARLSSTYRGALALMSFEPELMCAMRIAAPGIPRGLVAADPENNPHVADRVGFEVAAHLARLEDFEAAGACFAAYDVNGLPHEATQRLRRAGVPVFTWTIREASQLGIAQKYADAPIFEGPIRQAIEQALPGSTSVE
ncbi:MAG: glycerophosphodiester phosphodiesterase [Alphaproteobacteria bacterium]|nr:glycerophosphodiester phosphodiesterase [Alphaproteobacteria bacterium]